MGIYESRGLVVAALLELAEYLVDRERTDARWYEGDREDHVFSTICEILDLDYDDEIIEEKHMSHDNKTGLVSIWGASIRDSIFKVGHRWWFHPRDIVFYGYMKHGFWFWPLLPIVSLANIISCARTYKYYDDRPEPHHRQLTTSGKMLAFVRNKSAGLKLTHKICTWLIKRNKHFGSWTKVAKLYFPNEGHPIPILMEENEKGL